MEAVEVVEIGVKADLVNSLNRFQRLSISATTATTATRGAEF